MKINMRKVLLIFLLLFSLAIKGQGLFQVCQINYVPCNNNSNTHTTRGTQRSPVNVTNLPITWIEGSFIHFEWTSNISSVDIYIRNNFGVLEDEYTYESVSGRHTTIDVSNLEEGTYTLYISILGQLFQGSFIL